MANGALSLSALFLIIIFMRYCWRNRRSFWINRTVQLAGAVLVLMIGHCVRATGAWVEFILLRNQFDLSEWLKYSAVWFTIAAALIIYGKILMLYSFTPTLWRWRIIIPGILA